jgi:hypothetical protein
MNLYPDEYSLAKEYVDSHWSDSSSIKRLSFGSSTSTGEEAIYGPTINVDKISSQLSFQPNVFQWERG